MILVAFFFTCFAEMDSPRTQSLFTTVRVRIVMLVVRWTSRVGNTLLVMGSTTMVQLTPAPLVLACTSWRTGLRYSLCASVDGLPQRWFFDVLAACGAVESVVQGPVPMKCLCRVRSRQRRKLSGVPAVIADS